MSERRLHCRTPQRVLRGLLGSLLLTLMCAPRTERLWIASPWIEDLDLFDNTYGQLRGLLPDNQTSSLRLLPFLVALQAQGTDVRVLTHRRDARRPGRDHLAAHFLAKSTDVLGPDRVRVSSSRFDGFILSDTFVLSGSLELARSGIRIQERFAHISSDPARVSRGREGFDALWQGEGT